LWFGENSVAPDGEYYVRGGICWPTNVELRVVTGFAVVAGLHLASGTVYVLDERPFVVIDHVLGGDGLIAHHGCASWLTRAWAKYRADVFYWHQDILTAKRYRLQVIRSANVVPQPQFAEVAWDDDDAARLVVLELEATGRLRYRRESELHNDILACGADPEGEHPAMHALTCLCAGLDRYPCRTQSDWRERAWRA